MKPIQALFGCCLLALPARQAGADATGEAVRSTLAKYKQSVVTLSLVVKMSAPSMGEDQSELEAGALVIDASGLVVTTNSAIDPAAMMSRMMGEDMGGQISSKVVSVKIITGAGDEIAAKVVLRDKDRNLAYLRPLHPIANPMTPIDFSGGAKAQVGDPVLVLSRLGKAGNRSVEGLTRRIVSTLERPQLYYVMDVDMFYVMAGAVFNEQGEPLGMSSLRVVNGRHSSQNFSDSFMPIVIPASLIAEVAHQAPQAKDVKDPLVPPKPTKPAHPKPHLPGHKS